MSNDNREIPAEWQDAMIEAEAWDPRNKRPSVNALARMAKVHATTVGYMIFGGRDTGDDAIAAVGKVLDRNTAEMHALMAIRGTDAVGRFEVPDGADRLTLRQRAAVQELILSMVDPVKIARTGESTGQKKRPSQSGYDLAAHPELNTAGAAERRAAGTRGEESQEPTWED